MLELQVNPGTEGSKREQADASKELLLDLKMSAPDAEIKKQEVSGIAEHREFVSAVSTLLVSGIKLGVFAGMFEVLKTWLDRRPTAEVTLKAKDGSELKMSKVTPEEAYSFFERHLAEK